MGRTCKCIPKSISERGCRTDLDPKQHEVIYEGAKATV